MDIESGEAFVAINSGDIPLAILGTLTQAWGKANCKELVVSDSISQGTPRFNPAMFASTMGFAESERDSTYYQKGAC